MNTVLTNPDLREWDVDLKLDQLAEPFEAVCRPIRANGNPEAIFRYPCCGLATELIERTLHDEGFIETQQIMADVRCNLGPIKMRTKHVFLKVESGGETFYIDGTYSQFFKPIGMDEQMIHYGANPFPLERAIVFTKDDVPDLIDWLCDISRMFWQKYNCSPAYLKRHLYISENDVFPNYFKTRKPPSHVSDQHLRAYFSDIYDLSKYNDFSASNTVIETADEIIEKTKVDTSGAYL